MRPEAYLDPLLAVDLHAVGPQRGDGPVNDLLHHLRVPIGLLQLGRSDPDVPVRGDVLAGLVQYFAGIFIGLQPCQGEPELRGGSAGTETYRAGGSRWVAQGAPKALRALGPPERDRSTFTSSELPGPASGSQSDTPLSRSHTSRLHAPHAGWTGRALCASSF